MTYTFKLARRLAVSRDFAMLATILLVAACTGESTGPETGPAIPKTATALQVTPRSVTLEPHQKVKFKGLVRTSTGDTVAAPVDWVASGGTIDGDGSYTAGEPGSYKVVGRGRGRGWKRADTSIVVVVPTQPDLVSLSVAPDPVSLNAGGSRTFSATGHLSDGTTAAVGVTWTATGGTIDPGGVYTAGQIGGAFRVVATHSGGSYADTASVSVAAAEPAPEPAPTLAKLILRPISVSLETGASQRFTAWGRNSLGDSVAVTVAFSATGGTITSDGLYTAGSTGGTYRVIASAGGFADTSAVTITQPTVTSGAVGLPFGPSHQIAKTGSIVVPFSMSSELVSASSIVSRINGARTGKYTLMTAMTGGSHFDYMSIIDGVNQFDEAKWRAKMDTYNTATIKQAVAQGVADGVIVGNLIMDEPYVSGGASGGGNTWGPKGTMTKARVDKLCAYVHGIFPTLPTGPSAQHNLFEPDKSYTVCDFFIDQYDHKRGDVRTFRDDGLAMARRDGHAIMFSLNILDGGVQDKDGTYDCTGPGQGGKGTYAPNCRMTAQQVRDWGAILGKAGCGLFMWRYDSGFVSDPENQLAFRDLGAGLATAPRLSCRRP